MRLIDKRFNRIIKNHPELCGKENNIIERSEISPVKNIKK